MLSQFENDTPPVPWTQKDIISGLSIVVVGGIAFIAFQGLIQILSIPIDFGQIVLFGESLLLVPVWFLTVRKYQVGWGLLGLRGFEIPMIFVGFVFMLISCGFNVVYASLLQYFNILMQPDLGPVFQQLPSPWLLLISGAIIAPIVEEIFFRGFVFSGLRQTYGWQKAMVISSLIFAVFHVYPPSFPPIFILGCIFALLYQASGSIWPAILMHMLTNTLALGGAYLASRPDLFIQ